MILSVFQISPESNCVPSLYKFEHKDTPVGKISRQFSRIHPILSQKCDLSMVLAIIHVVGTDLSSKVCEFVFNIFAIDRSMMWYSEKSHFIVLCYDKQAVTL